MLLKDAAPASFTVCAALTAHIYVQKREPTTLRAVFALVLGLPALLHALSRAGLVTLLWDWFGLNALLYNVVLLTSIIVYRLSPFHPLAKYPGPVICRTSRLWAFYKAFSRQQRFYNHQLFERYGDVVRVGPNHLIIRDAKAIPIMLGSGSPDGRWVRGLRHGVYLEGIAGSDGSLLEQVLPKDHSPRRRIWDRAFSPGSLKDYEPALQHRVDQLVDGLSRSPGKVIDLGSWFHCFSIDFMGDIGFASGFDFLEKGSVDKEFMQATMTNIATWEVLGTIPWSKIILRKVLRLHPYTRAGVMRGNETLNKRKSVKGLIRKDIFYHLMDEDGESGHSPLSHGTLISEAMVLLIAGADSVSVALSNVFFHLLTQPNTFAKLRDEVEKYIAPEVKHPDANDLAKLPYLRAVINETLRLNPAVPGGLYRRPPPNGRPALIGDMVIPQGTTVQIPTWSVHRDPRYFWPHPETFWPDRWLEGTEKTTPDFKLNTTAYYPFSFGSMGCVGKHLALNEIRLAIVTLIRNFDFKLDSEKLDHRRWEEKQTEIFVLANDELPVVATPRV